MGRLGCLLHERPRPDAAQGFPRDTLILNQEHDPTRRLSSETTASDASSLMRQLVDKYSNVAASKA